MAALTIPQLYNNYQKRVVEVQLKKTFSDFKNAVTLSEVENGSYYNWDYSLNSKEFVNKYIAPYMHLTPCFGYGQSYGVKDGCFVKKPPFLGFYAYNRDLTNLSIITDVQTKYLLSDNRAVSFFNGIHDKNKYLEFYVDVNGPKGKSIMGVDVFHFYLLVGGGRCGGLHLGASAANYGTWCRGDDNHKMKTCLGQIEIPYPGASCGYFLEKNDFKFPKDYPLKLKF